MAKKKGTKKRVSQAEGRNQLTLGARLATSVVVGLLFVFLLVQMVFSRSLHFLPFVQILIFAFFFLIFGLFAWLSFQEKEDKELINSLLIAAFLVTTIFYVAAFDQWLDVAGGDDAHYIIEAKSIAQGRGLRLLYEKSERPDLENPPMLPAILAPLVRLFGFKLVVLKTVPLLFTLGFLVFAFLFFKDYMPKAMTGLLLLLIATSPMIVKYSSFILTEMPFLFFVMLSLWLLERAYRSQKTFTMYLALASVFVAVSYLTREVALGFLVTSALYFVIKRQFKKALILACLNLLFFLPWTIRNAVLSRETAQVGHSVILPGGVGAETFFSKIMTNSRIAMNVIPQNMFSYNVAEQVHTSNYFWIGPVLLVVLFGYVRSFITKLTQMDLFVLSVALPVMVFSPEMASNVSRYALPVLPATIYYFYLAIAFLAGGASRGKVPKPVSQAVTVSLMAVMLFVNLGRGNQAIEYSRRREPYPDSYLTYLETAVWAKDNAPASGYFAVRKPRAFYLISGRKATSYIPASIERYGVWTPGIEAKILEWYRSAEIDFVVLDRASRQAEFLVYPTIRNHPEIFKPVYLTNGDPKAAVFEIQKDSLDKVTQPQPPGLELPGEADEDETP
jgi:4-amino-4-deoxy-L-arabinose transferase-like glycosyltransferase